VSLIGALGGYLFLLCIRCFRDGGLCAPRICIANETFLVPFALCSHGSPLIPLLKMREIVHIQ
jgi:hypothetical protein